MANYEFSKKADEDLDRIYAYGLEHFGEEQADEYLGHILDTLDNASSSPRMYPEYLPNIHKCFAGSETIFYRETQDGIFVLRILGSQDIGQELH